MNRGFRQTYGNYRRDTDSYSMRSGDRTHQENRPRNRRFDPSRAAFHERRENYTDAPPAYETIVPRNNQEHGGNHTDAPPAYETDAPPAYETIYQENRPG